MQQYLLDLIHGIQEGDSRYLHLKMEDGILKELPFQQFGQLDSIRGLIAKSHSISKIGTTIGEMTELEVVELSENPLVSLPPEMGNLTKLKSFRASEISQTDPNSTLDHLFSDKPKFEPEFTSPAGLRDLPDSFKNWKEIESLTLDNNRFSKIPDCIFEMTALKSLDLAFNVIEEISPKIGNLVNLEYLKLSYNQFTKLPKTIGNLKNLRRLRLDSLKFETFPKEIGDLENLEMLEFCHGEIQKIPAEIKNLKNLKYLYFMNTEISDVDKNMLQMFLPEMEIHY